MKPESETQGLTAVQVLARALDEFGYGTKQGSKDAASLVERLDEAGWLRKKQKYQPKVLP